MVFKKYAGGNNNNNVFTTNDLGKMKNNKLFFKSRENQMIVSGGENINLLTIKNALFRFQDSFNPVVVAYDDLIWGKIPVVVYEKNDLDKSVESMKKYCKQVLPKFMIPKHFVKIEKIPVKKNKDINYKLIQNFLMESLK